MDYPKSVPGVGLSNGKFVDDNPITGAPGSLIPASWGNLVTDELLSIVQAGGLEPSEVAHDQLLIAIRTIIQSSLPPEKIRTTLAEYGITNAYTKDEVEALVRKASSLPVGSMVPFPKGTVPAGFLEADHSVQSIAVYPDLYAYLGTTFNDGTETAGYFRLPESRGEFLRGWDHGRGVDIGRTIGTWQNFDIQSHDHAQNGVNNLPSNQGAGGLNAFGRGIAGVPTDKTGGAETRPRNIAVMWCIKAWSAPVNQGNIDVAALAAQLQGVQKNAVIGTHRGLTISTSGLNSLVSIAADQLVVGNEVSSKILSAVSLSVNAAVVGVNGLDSGSLTASTWYGVWVIWNGTTTAGLFSQSTTAPTMPGGYTHKALVGWIRTDATANKYPLGMTWADRRWTWKVAAGTNLLALPVMASGAVGSITAPTWIAVPWANFAPPMARKITIVSSNGSGTTIVAPNNAYGASASTTNPPPIQNSASGAQLSWLADLILESSNIYWAANAAGAALFSIGGEI